MGVNDLVLAVQKVNKLFFSYSCVTLTKDIEKYLTVYQNMVHFLEGCQIFMENVAQMPHCGTSFI